MNIAFDIMFGKMTKQLSTEFGKRQHYRTELSSPTAANALVCGGRCMAGEQRAMQSSGGRPML